MHNLDSNTRAVLEFEHLSNVWDLICSNNIKKSSIHVILDDLY